MPQVVTLTMNPALDLSTAVEEVKPFSKLRCGAVRRDPGGGGINVARIVNRLGGEATALYLAGGLTGQSLRALIDAQGVASRVVAIAGETREDFTVFETRTGKQFRFVTPGPEVAPNECRDCLVLFGSLCAEARFAVVSGSLPPGVPVDFFAAAAREAKMRGARLALDTSSVGLEAALREAVFLIKPNQHEFAGLLGLESPALHAMIAGARGLIASGHVEAIALSLADEGAVLVTAEKAWRAEAPRIEPVSTVGAGDSFLGAMIWSLAAQQDWAEALRIGVAAGSAALLSAGTDLAHPHDITRLAAEIEVAEIT